MGMLQDIGVLDSGKKLTEKAWKKFVDDVKKKLSTGFGPLPVKLSAFPDLPPMPGAQLMRLEDKKLFPEFETKWRQRYEDMAKSMDVDGAFGLSQQTKLPIADPTAIAVQMGSPPPQMQFSEALQKVLVPPVTPLELLTSIGDPSLTTVTPDPELSPEEQKEEQAKKEGQSIDKMMEILAAQIPIPPIPVPPNPQLQELGYTEEYSQAEEASLAPVLTYAEVQLPTTITQLPSALGNLPMGILDVYAAPAANYSPKTIEGCDFDALVNQTIEEHKVKFGALSYIGQNVGSGVLTSALASTPFDQGGLAITDEIPDEDLEPTLMQALTPVRMRIKQIIENFFEGKPNNPNAYVSNIEHKDKWNKNLGEWDPPFFYKQIQDAKNAAAEAEAELEGDGTSDLEFYGVSSDVEGNLVSTTSDSGSDFSVYNPSGITYTTVYTKIGNKAYKITRTQNLNVAGEAGGGASNLSEVGIISYTYYEWDGTPNEASFNTNNQGAAKALIPSNPNYNAFKKLADQAAAAKETAAANNLLAKVITKDAKKFGPIATTCGSLPAYVFRQLGVNPKHPYYDGVPKGRFKDNEPTPPPGGPSGNGPAALPTIGGGGLEALRQAGRYLGCWVEGIKPDGTWTGLFPKEGDVFLIVGDSLCYKNNATTKQNSEGFSWNYTYDTNVLHVGIIYDKYGAYLNDGEDADYENPEQGANIWISADAGQGSVLNGEQKAEYVKRGIAIPLKRADGEGWAGKLSIDGEQDTNGGRPKRYLGGWIDVDKLVIVNPK